MRIHRGSEDRRFMIGSHHPVRVDLPSGNISTELWICAPGRQTMVPTHIITHELLPFIAPSHHVIRETVTDSPSAFTTSGLGNTCCTITRQFWFQYPVKSMSTGFFCDFARSRAASKLGPQGTPKSFVSRRWADSRSSRARSLATFPRPCAWPVPDSGSPRTLALRYNWPWRRSPCRRA